MPLAWSGGWLFEQLAQLEANPQEFWKGPVGFGDDDPDYDPAFAWVRDLPVSEDAVLDVE